MKGPRHIWRLDMPQASKNTSLLSSVWTIATTILVATNRKRVWLAFRTFEGSAMKYRQGRNSDRHTITCGQSFRRWSPLSSSGSKQLLVLRNRNLQRSCLQSPYSGYVLLKTVSATTADLVMFSRTWQNRDGLARCHWKRFFRSCKQLYIMISSCNRLVGILNFLRWKNAVYHHTCSENLQKLGEGKLSRPSHL